MVTALAESEKRQNRNNDSVPIGWLTNHRERLVKADDGQPTRECAEKVSAGRGIFLRDAAGRLSHFNRYRKGKR